MRLPREVVVLLTLLVAAMAAVLAYVIYRRAHLPKPHTVAVPATPPAVAAPAAKPPPVPAPKVQGTESVDLTQHDAQTIDFSHGHPEIKQSAADRAALNEGLKDISEATKDVTFGPGDAAPADPPPKK
ncbi:MAG TPA: hypothetical protein VHD32_08055 [Candidatus Didemnitutus sp.]|nr:hypothetical protein [Candidatus Didemnitutus sp.]